MEHKLCWCEEGGKDEKDFKICLLSRGEGPCLVSKGVTHPISTENCIKGLFDSREAWPNLSFHQQVQKLFGADIWDTEGIK